MSIRGSSASQPRSGLSSLNHLIGSGEQRLRHGKAEHLGGFEVDHQLEFGWLLDRQIGRLGALQDLSRVNAGLTKGTSKARSIADEAAGHSELTQGIDHRNGML